MTDTGADPFALLIQDMHRRHFQRDPTYWPMAILLEGRCTTSSRSYQTLALERAAALKPTPLRGERAAAAPAVSERLRHVCFCGMQWRAIGQLCDIPFSTLYTLFAPGSGCGCSTA
jgi:hypothetical protein